MRRLLTLLLLALLALPATAAPPPIEEVASGPYRLGTGDEIRINVYGLPAASSSYLVGDGGSVSVPLVGSVPVVGRTTAEVEAALAQALKDKQILREPSVTVEVAKYRPFYIMGEVQRPGQYAYVPGMTVMNAVSIAGGYTFRANRKKATITRPVEGAAREGSAKPETRVLPGDTVVVPEAWF